MRQDIIDLYDEYTHERLDRRVFMDRLASIAGGTAAAAALVPLLEAISAKAAIVPADDPRLQTERITFAGAAGDVQGYLARPAGAAGPLPGVDYTIYIYEGANHAFHNDTSEARYDQDAAELAWSRTIDFLKQHLGS